VTGVQTCALPISGLDHRQHEIIELAMVPFRYSVDGIIVRVLEPFSQLQQPADPIPAEITALTGITNEIVSGKKIDIVEVNKLVEAANIIIAHNASFDRKFLEKLSPAFETKPWACSLADIDWFGEGYDGLKLNYLASEFGFFYDRHRAENDCLAGIEILSRPLKKSGLKALDAMLNNARKVTWRIVAEGSPFDLKETLKARGYRWNAGENGQPKAWYIDVVDQQKDAEVAFLNKNIFKRNIDLRLVRITALERHSDRI
jgi:DNA polymerase III subunit epsilon